MYQVFWYNAVVLLQNVTVITKCDVYYKIATVIHWLWLILHWLLIHLYIHYIYIDYLFFFFFFLYQGFLSQTLTTHRTAGEGRGLFFLPLYHFHPLTNIQTFMCNSDDDYNNIFRWNTHRKLEHASGTIHHMIVIYDTHVWSDISPGGFFFFSKFWCFGLLGR